MEYPAPLLSVLNLEPEMKRVLWAGLCRPRKRGSRAWPCLNRAGFEILEPWIPAFAE